jgi:hypothetical protein
MAAVFSKMMLQKWPVRENPALHPNDGAVSLILG